jgi:hypothetical protein
MHYSATHIHSSTRSYRVSANNKQQTNLLSRQHQTCVSTLPSTYLLTYLPTYVTLFLSAQRRQKQKTPITFSEKCQKYFCSHRYHLRLDVFVFITPFPIAWSLGFH